MNCRSLSIRFVSAAVSLALCVGLPAKPQGGGSTPPPNPAIAFVDSGLKVMNADGTNVRTVVALGRRDSVAGPSWSPDGQQLAFCGVRGGVRGIWRVNLDGTGIQLLAPQAGIVLSSTDWSRAPAPDGRFKITFRSTGVGDALDVFVVNTDGTGLQNLTNSNDQDSSPGWTRDGTGIYHGTLPTSCRLMQLGAVPGGGVTALASVDMLTNWDFIECQVGNTSNLLLFRGGPGPGFPTAGIWVVDTTVLPWSPQLVYADGQVQRAPAFAPNDQRIVLRRNGNGQTAGIFTANPDGSGALRIRSSGTDVAWRHN